MPHLLLVDDDEDILALLTSFFRKHSHIVSTAMNSAEMFTAMRSVGSPWSCHAPTWRQASTPARRVSTVPPNPAA